MIFTTWLYAIFLLVAVLGTWLLPARIRPWWLIAAGIAFYANYHPPHLPVVLAATAIVYLGARAADRPGLPARGRVLAGLGVGALALLGYYKYTAFALDTGMAAGLLAPETGRLFVPARPPLAISFFVFEYVHWLIEVRRGTFAPGRPRDFTLFIMFFPTLVCGPIKRYGDFQPQIATLGRPPAPLVAQAVQRIVIGLAKKLIVADAIAHVTGPLWASPLGLPWGMLWVITYAYAIQILFDFSGYTDIAVGSAMLLNVHVPENFDYPYARRDIARFWRSWHMSLTSWITDYVYIPLGGNRGGPVRAAGNRLLSMALCGLWHGAAGHFVLWGLYHGIALNVQRGWRIVRTRLGVPGFGRAGVLLAWFVTFHVVCIGWVLFVVDAATAWAVIRRMLGLG